MTLQTNSYVNLTSTSFITRGKFVELEHLKKLSGFPTSIFPVLGVSLLVDRVDREVSISHSSHHAPGYIQGDKSWP